MYQSNVDLTNAHITSLCDISGEFITSSKGVYFFNVDYSTAPDCKNGNIVLSIGEDDYANTIHGLDLVKDIDLYSVYLDYSSEKLAEYQTELQREIKETSIYKNYDGKNILKYYGFLIGQERYKIASHKNALINSILSARQQAYISPVEGESISTIPNRVPNAGRPYRESYTDGIHHGWDVYADL